MLLGLSLSICGGQQGSGTPSFDPSTLALSGWWRGDDYVPGTGTWPGRASAGASGGRDLTEATNRPSAGAEANGHASVDFDGANDELRSALAISNFISAGEFSFWCVFEVDDFGGMLQLPSASPCLLTDGSASNYWAIGVSGVSGSTAAVRNYEFDGGDKVVDAAPLTVATRYLVECRHAGGTLYTRIGNGAEQSAAGGNVGSLAGTLFCGRNYNGTWFLDGRIWEMAIAPSNIDDADRQAFRDYLLALYDL